MPISYRIDKARRLVLCVGTGVLTDADAVSNHRLVAADSDFDPTYDELLDFREVETMVVTASLPQTIAADHIWAEGVKRAFVAPSDLTFGMTRMYEMLADDKPGNVRVFRDMEDALSWLELGDDGDSRAAEA
jgi:hypothetical protein